MNGDETLSGERPNIEDYGSPATDDLQNLSATGPGSGLIKGGQRGEDQDTGSGQYGGDAGGGSVDTAGASGSFSSAGGTLGIDLGSSEGEETGEFGETGQGTDLTVEMMNTDARSGLIKGGQAGADDAAGPAQYGGDSGGLGENN